MEKYYDYSDHIEKAMSSFSNEKTNFVFKRRVLDEMELRTKEVIKRGLGDKRVAHDLIMDEYNPQRIVKDYYEYLEDIKEKKKIKYTPIAAVTCILLSVLVFLIIGFVTDIWHPTWLIIEGTATAGVMAIMLTAVTILRRHKKFYAIMRALVAGSVMVGTQFLFLFIRILFDNEQAYLIFLFALAMMFIGDLVLATVTKQRLVFVNYLITIPLVFIFAFVIFGLITGLWSVGRILIVIGFVLDIGVIIQLAIRNKKLAYNPEDEE